MFRIEDSLYVAEEWMDERVSHHNRGAIKETDAAFIAPVILDSTLPFANLSRICKDVPGPGNQACPR